MMQTREVFISYARMSAGEAAHALLDSLLKAGIDTYLETEEIPSGSPFPKHLAAAMRASRVVVIFADPTYFTRQWCVYEFLIAIAPYRQEPDGKDVLQHVVIGLGADVDTVLPHLPPPLAQVSWPALAETESMTQLVIERLREQETTLGERLAKLDDAVVDALAGGGAIPAPRPLTHVDDGPKPYGPRCLESLPDSLQERFFGRHAELWELFHLLETRRAGGSPASCLVEGVDGLGKTQLVAEYVWRYGDRYPGGIVWIDASDEADLARQLDDVGKQFGDGDNSDIDQLVQQAATKGQILWVVDQLPEPAPGERPRSVATWCPAHHHVTLLATSQRTGIRKFDEHVRLSELNVDDAVALLTRAPVDAAAIDHFGWIDLAHWIGCMPLALEILHESLAEGMASADVMLARARSDEPSPQLDEEMTILAEDLPTGALRGIYETFQIAYANLAGRPEILRAAHRLAWLRSARMYSPWIDSLVDASSRTLLAKRSWLDYRPRRYDDHASSSWRMHRIVGSFLRTCSPDPDSELVEVFNWLRDACVTATPSETFQLDRHASTLYQRVFVLAERNGPAGLRCIQAAAEAASQLVVLQLDDFERRGTRYLSAKFLTDIGAGVSLVELLRDFYDRESDAAAKSIAALLSALTGVREAAKFCAEILSDTKDDARWQAYMSAASLGFPDVLGVPYIDSLIKEDNVNIRNNMQTGFANMFPVDGSGLDPVLMRLGELLESSDPRNRALAVALVGRLLGAHPAAVNASQADPTSALRQLALQDLEVGELAARELASVDDSAIYDLLVKQLKESAGDRSAAVVRLCAYLDALEYLPPPQVKTVDRDEGMEIRGNFFSKAKEVEPELYAPIMAVLNDVVDKPLTHTILCNMTSRGAQLALVDEAQRLLDAGDNEHVLQFSDQVEAAQEALISVTWWRGQAYEALHRDEEAISAYTETLNVTPAFYDAAMRRGTLLHMCGQHEQALEDLDRVVCTESKWAGAWYVRCGILTKLDRYDDALASIDRALELGSNVAEYHYWRSSVCQHLNRWDEAISSITEALTRTPEDERFLEMKNWLRSNRPKEI